MVILLVLVPIIDVAMEREDTDGESTKETLLLSPASHFSLTLHKCRIPYPRALAKMVNLE